MKVPVTLQIAGLALAMTGFYTLVGQAVPQKEVHPPEVIEVSENVTTAELVEIGQTVFEGKGLCTTCHTIGRTGALRFPDLQGIAERAATRIPGYSQIDYFAESLYEPDAFIVEGFNPGMQPMNKAPFNLTEAEILAVIAYLQTLGGQATVNMQTQHAYNGGSLGGAGGAEAAPEVSAEADGDSPTDADTMTDRLTSGDQG